MNTFLAEYKRDCLAFDALQALDDKSPLQAQCLRRMFSVVLRVCVVYVFNSVCVCVGV